VTKKFNAPAQGALGVNGEFVGIHQHYALKHIVVVALHICFGKIFEFVTDEFDALAVGAIDKHDIGFNPIAIALIDLVYEIANNSAFAGAGRTVKNEIGDFSNRNEILQLFEDIFVFGVHMNNRENDEISILFYTFAHFISLRITT